MEVSVQNSATFRLWNLECKIWMLIIFKIKNLLKIPSVLNETFGGLLSYFQPLTTLLSKY